MSRPFISVLFPSGEQVALRESVDKACFRLDCDWHAWPDNPLSGASALLFVDAEGGDVSLQKRAEDAASSMNIPFVKVCLAHATDSQWLAMELSPYCYPLESDIEQLKRVSRNAKIGFLVLGVLTVLFFSLFAVYFRKFKDAQDCLDIYSWNNSEMENLLDDVSEYSPIWITDVLIGNEDKYSNLLTDYGDTIYDSQAKYLAPLVQYIGFRSGGDSLFVKVYNPNGELMRLKSSPEGYTYSYKVYIMRGTERTMTLGGWGSESGTYYKSGTHRIEIWTKDRLLFTKYINILKDFDPEKEKMRREER